MAWKKIIFSGSSAHLSAVTASYFSGDGSALTNVTVSQAATVSSTFTNQTSVAVDHNFDSKNIVVSVYDSNDVQIIPASVTLTSLDRVTVAFDSLTSGLIVVAKGGHLVSGSISADNIDGLDTKITALGYATTGSNTFIGNQTVQGHILPSLSASYDLGSADKPWRDLYVSTASIKLIDETGAVVKSINVDNLVSKDDSPEFTNLTVAGNLTVQGTTTTVDSTTVTFADNIIALNGTGAANAGIEVNDNNGPASGSFIWDGSNNYWKAGGKGSEIQIALKEGQGLVSSSAQIASNISGSFTSVSSSLASRISNISTDFADITNKPTLLSGSAQIAADISGSFTNVSSSLASRIDNISTDFADITNKPTLISSSAQVNADSITNFDSNVKAKMDADNVISGSTFSSPSQGTVRATINGANTDVDTGLQVGDTPTFAGLTINGDLTVTGNTFEAQVSNLNVEDKFIIVNSGSASGDSGLIFGGSDPAGTGAANQGAAIFWDGTNDVFGFAEDLASNATSASLTSKIGNIETHATNDPSAAPTFQGKGTIYVNESSETIWMYS